MSTKIQENAQRLLLSYIAHHYDLHLKEAAHTDMPHDAFLDDLLAREVEQRRNNRLKKRLSNARFPYKKYLVDFDRTAFPSPIARTMKALESLEFIQNKENLVLIGNPGVGKTHLAIALGIEACMQDLRVLFTHVPNLLTEMRESMSQNRMGAFRRKFEKYDVVILDELGYISFDKEGNEMLFNLLSSRNDKGSIIVTTNLVFECWDEVFHDPILTAALVDRLAHKSYVLDMTGDSYRIKETKQWLEKHEQK